MPRKAVLFPSLAPSSNNKLFFYFFRIFCLFFWLFPIFWSPFSIGVRPTIASAPIFISGLLRINPGLLDGLQNYPVVSGMEPSGPANASSTKHLSQVHSATDLHSYAAPTAP